MVLDIGLFTDFFLGGMIIPSESPDFPGMSRQYQNCVV